MKTPVTIEKPPHMPVWVAFDDNGKPVIALTADYAASVERMVRWGYHVKDVVPAPGIGATICHWSDRTACTITRVKMNAAGTVIKIWVREDIAWRADNNGMSEDQRYNYRPGHGPETLFTLRKNGRFVREGQPQTGTGLTVGMRSQYHDYSF